MAEYIEREAFIAEKREHFCMDCNKRKGIKGGKVQFCYDIGDAPCRSCDVEDMLDYIDSFPAADVVEVVRCGDCKYADNYGLDLMCQKHSGVTNNKLGEDIHFVEWHSKNFFCADGARKDGDGE